MDKEETQKLYKSLIIPSILLFILWIIKVCEYFFNISFADYGISPRSIEGLRGILFSPLLHSDFKHLAANSIPLVLLIAALYYYYEGKAKYILAFCWGITGIWVWIFAQGTGIHIGASGVVYALVAFHFTSGVLRKEPRMMAFSLLLVFLYGSLVWGIVPDFYPEKNISWESHLLGMVAGILVAIAYKNEGWQRKEYIWEEEDDDEEIDYEYLQDENQDTELVDKPLQNQSQVHINYEYKESTEKQD